METRELFAGFDRYVYTRRHTQAKTLLGGIGTGSISLGSRGQLLDFELFNRPSKGLRFPYSFFALHCGGARGFTRVLESRLTPPYDCANGLPAAELGGLPRFKDSEMRVRFPFTQIRFIDEALPVNVIMEAFNPFIPLNAEDSGVPAALVRFSVENVSAEALAVSVAGSLYNASGYDGADNYLNFKNRGTPVNTARERDGLSGIYMDNPALDEKDTMGGNLSIMTPDRDVTRKTEWRMGQRIDGAHAFWDDFSGDGRLEDKPGFMGEAGKLDRHIGIKIGSLATHRTIAPGETGVFTFVISWYFPFRTKSWPKDDNLCHSESAEVIRNYYATRFAGSWEAGAYLLKNLPRLEGDSAKFAGAVYSGTLPEEVIDAMTANLFILKSATCFRVENGHMFAFEGCLDNIGSCPGNCTHVWYYAQAMAYLFPELERDMRRTDFLVETDDTGEMQFRAMRELNGESWGFIPAADGQLGTVARLYREWLLSGDGEFLRELWPKAKLALDYALRVWDRDGDCVLDAMKHVDYDVEFYGIDPLTNFCLLAALKSAVKMAEGLGDADAAARYRGVCEKAASRADEIMWSKEGGYYIQVLDDVDAYKYQHGRGCLADQLIGQFYAHLTGLGPLAEPGHVKQAALSIFRHNFLRDFTGHANMQRVYAVNDDAGLLMTTWPLGGRPLYPFFYSEEAWGRTEYHVAATLIYEGFIEEGLEVVRAVRGRYDGVKRNPFNEFECGWHYSGIMSGWGLLPALSGYLPDLPNGKMSFSPVINQDDFRCFWSNGRAWGVYRQTRKDGVKTCGVEVLYGDLGDMVCAAGGSC